MGSLAEDDVVTVIGQERFDTLREQIKSAAADAIAGRIDERELDSRLDAIVVHFVAEQRSRADTLR